MKCPVCGTDNPAESLFCSRCTSPVSVVALGELTDADRRLSLAALLKTLAPIVEREPKNFPTSWPAYLSAFWLRPETALILAGECDTINKVSSPGPWLDLGCGDGVHAALYSNWKFARSFDVFQSLDPTAGDIYNRFDPKSFHVEVIERGRKIDFGIDIKPTAVERARALKVFESVMQADATKLPIKDDSIGTIFSNMLRDLDDPLPSALNECRRVLRRDGRLLLSTMTPAYADSLYFAPQAREAEQRSDSKRAKQLLKLDRGRSVFCRSQRDLDAWKKLLDNAGLKLLDTIPIVGSEVINFWDIGLRPFTSPLLARLESWRANDSIESIKTASLELLHQLIDGLASDLTRGETCMQMLVIGRAR